MAQDRLDLAEIAKCLARRMSELREFDLIHLKRVARYLGGEPRAAIRFRREERIKNITISVDTDFAGDPVSRKSTTGLVAQVGGQLVKKGSALQRVTAFSLGEAEFRTVVKRWCSGTFLEGCLLGLVSSDGRRCAE